MHKKQLSIATLTAVLLLAATTLTACGSSVDQINSIVKNQSSGGQSSSGQVQTAQGVDTSDMEDGVYVYDHNTKKFYKAYSSDVSYGNTDDSQYVDEDDDSANATMEMTTRQDFIWEAYADNAIPVIHKGDKLAYKVSDSAPGAISLYPMNDYGYTIGTAIYLNSNDATWCISSQNEKSACPNSSFEAQLQNKNLDTTSGQVRISDIGGVKITDKMVTNVGTIKGLKLNKKYKVGIYIGTIYQELLCTVDTHVFTYANADVVTSSNWEYTKNGYVFVKLPKHMENGYYYISGYGLIRYEAGKNSGRKVSF